VLNALSVWRGAQAAVAAILGEKQFQELTDQLAKLTNQGGWGG
jgi:hypothetical protein